MGCPQNGKGHAKMSSDLWRRGPETVLACWLVRNLCCCWCWCCCCRLVRAPVMLNVCSLTLPPVHPSNWTMPLNDRIRNSLVWQWINANKPNGRPTFNSASIENALLLETASAPPTNWTVSRCCQKDSLLVQLGPSLPSFFVWFIRKKKIKQTKNFGRRALKDCNIFSTKSMSNWTNIPLEDRQSINQSHNTQLLVSIQSSTSL